MRVLYNRTLLYIMGHNNDVNVQYIHDVFGNVFIFSS